MMFKMMISTRASILFALLIILPNLTCGVEIVGDDVIPLGQYGEYAIEKESTSIENIISGHENLDFKAIKSRLPNFGATGQTRWLRVYLENFGSNLDKILTVALLEMTTEAYLVDKNQEIEKLAPILDSWEWVYSIKLKQNQSKWLYVRIDPVIHLSGSFKLFTLSQYFEREKSIQFGLGAYYITILILTGYNLLLYFGLKNRSYLHYSIYALSLAMLQTVYDGSSYTLHNTPVYTNIMGMFVLSLSGASSIAFSSGILSVSKHFPKWSKFLKLVIFFYLLGCVLSPWPHLLDDFSAIIGFGGPILLIITGIKSLLRGNPIAKVYLCAISTYVATMVIHTSDYLGFNLLHLQNDLSTSMLLKTGSIIEIFLLALILTSQVKQLEKEKKLLSKNS